MARKRKKNIASIFIIFMVLILCISSGLYFCVKIYREKKEEEYRQRIAEIRGEISSSLRSHKYYGKSFGVYEFEFQDGEEKSGVMNDSYSDNEESRGDMHSSTSNNGEGRGDMHSSTSNNEERRGDMHGSISDNEEKNTGINDSILENKGVKNEHIHELYSKNENLRVLPASIAKLFTIEYASTLVDLDDIVDVRQSALDLFVNGTSKAGIEPKKYYVRNLFEAMLQRSGNDAAYALADYCGGILDGGMENSRDRVNLFMKKQREYMKSKGYMDTVMYDPSGFDYDAFTSLRDISKLSYSLMKRGWFRDIVGTSWYESTLPDGSKKSYRNTNTFINPKSTYYNKNVGGIKTGSMSGLYSICVYYGDVKHGYLIVSMDTDSSQKRYKDVDFAIKIIEKYEKN